MEKHYKSDHFKVPEGYFESLPAEVTKKINAISNRNGAFSVPDNYFESFPKSIQWRLKLEQKTRRIPQKKVRILHAAVIAVLLLFSFWNEKTTLDYDLIQYAEEYYTYEADAYETATLAELETIQWINDSILDQLDNTNDNFREYPNPYDFENLNTYDDEDSHD